jgi:hypothetical protein
MGKLKVGMIVNYQTTEQDQNKMSEHRSVCNVRAELPAVVVAVNGKDSVNLKVLLDGQGDIWATSSPQGDTPGCWSFYPEEKKDKKDKEVKTANPPAGDPPAGDLPAGDQE